MSRLLGENSADPNVSSLSSSLQFQMRCLRTEPSSILHTAFSLTRMSLHLPLSVVILHLGLRRWQQRRSSSSAAPMSHSDFFTHLAAVIELIDVLGCVLLFIGIHGDDSNAYFSGVVLSFFVWYGEMNVNVLTCVERYLAVAHPITYLKLRSDTGTRIRNMICCCFWFSSFIGIGLVVIGREAFYAFFLLTLSLVVVSFCSLSVLCILIRPGPGEQGQNKPRVDPSKQRAFLTIVAILLVLLLRYVSEQQPSSSSSSSLLFSSHCLQSKPSSFISIRILILLPLYAFILQHGLHRWKQKLSASHSDYFTSHVAVMKLADVISCVLCSAGIYGDHPRILIGGIILSFFLKNGETLFHILTCVERYLAIVHPVTHLRLKNKRGVRIRAVSTGCVWLLRLVGIDWITEDVSDIALDFCMLLISLTAVCFCNVAVHWALTRPGPANQRKRIDPSKMRAFLTILAVLMVLLLRFLWDLIWLEMYFKSETA
ncbi:uncharacterized protein LOC103480698 [Poecilia reticulata]|uniref:uncharacterized protein LOC103480698 n=1 Tax=Poecilia reticulata TaxID=8081 RepID=UPI0007E98F66|nr:PREDICTED: uncharacterized protein LOC103480698 [Poecilia reticulata]